MNLLSLDHPHDPELVALAQDLKDRIVFDDELKGWGLRISNGKKGTTYTWIVQARLSGRPHCRPKRKKLGDWSHLKPALARELAEVALASLHIAEFKGTGDPFARNASAPVMFKKAVERYLEVAKALLRPNTFYDTKRYLEGSYFRPFATMALSEITPRDVVERIDAIAADNTPKAANAALKKLSAFFSHAQAKTWITVNPVAGIKPLPVKERAPRPLTPGELAVVWNATDATTSYGQIIRLLVPIGARVNEIAGLRWEELSLDHALWVLPSGRAKNKKPLRVTLTPATIAILKALPQQDSGPVFPGWEDRNHHAHKQRLDEASKIAPWHVHDLRATMATAMGDYLEIDDRVVDLCLNHIEKRSRNSRQYNAARYARKTREAWRRWAALVEQVIANPPPKILTWEEYRDLVDAERPSNVIPLAA